MKQKIIVCTVILLLVIVGCATKKVSMRLTLPSRAIAMQEKQSVLVIPFGGSRGREATNTIRAGISRGKFHNLIANGSLEQTRLAELEKAIESGQRIDLSNSQANNASVMVSGSTLPDDYSSEKDSWQNEECAKTNKKGKCIATHKVTYYRLSETCTAGVSLRIVNVMDGATILERNFFMETKNEKSQKGSYPSSTRRQLCKRASEGAIFTAVTFVTPYKTLVELEFNKVGDSADFTERAIKMTRINKLRKANNLFIAVIKDQSLSEKERAFARYNLALSFWTLGRFDDCIDQLDEAQMVLKEKSGFAKFWSGDSPMENLRVSCEEYLQ